MQLHFTSSKEEDCIKNKLKLMRWYLEILDSNSCEKKVSNNDSNIYQTIKQTNTM